MKGICFLLACLALAGCSSHTLDLAPAAPSFASTVIMDDSARDESVLRTNAALKSYREQYTKAEKHKAFAQSASGAWNWRADRTTREYAVENALMGCRANNKAESEFPCKIINIDDEWAGR